MKLIETYIKGLYLIEPTIYCDSRGWFSESYNYNELLSLGIDVIFVQDNHSQSNKKGVLRGLHFQNEPVSQTKLIRCTRGSIWDVAVDLRKSSQTYLRWFGIELSESNKLSLLIPKGFAHGFIALEDSTEIQYKVDNLYDKSKDRSIRFNDPILQIKWPKFKYILSEKDLNAPFLNDSDVNFL